MNGTVYQLDADGHRGTAAVRRLVEYAPSTGALALWMQHRDVEVHPDDPHAALDSPVANDGLTLYYLPAVTRLPLREQTGLVAHQVLHVALRHVARREALARQVGPLDDRLWNGVADAIVNASLSHHDWLDLPAGAVCLQDLLRRTLGIDASLEASLQRWDTESLYRAIDDRGQAGRSARNNERDGGTAADSGDDDARPATGTDTSPVPDTATPLPDGPRAEAARECFRTMQTDLLPGSREPVESAERNAREWRERLGRAHAADGVQSLLRALGADRQPARTPWQLHLRTRLARALNHEPELSWSRPSRSWLANRGRTASGRRLPWEPGTTGQRSVPRLVILLDVSGSVDGVQLAGFGREIARVQRLHRADLWLIIGDDRVRDERCVRVGQPLFDARPVAGGEGTDYRPLLAAAARHRPDLVIVLGDLDGPVGEAPGFPVIWATPRSSEVPTPFGIRLWLD